MRYARSCRRGNTARRLAVLLLLPGMALAAPETPSSMQAGGAWSLPTLGSARSGVAYFTVTNSGQADDALLAAATPRSGRVEMHRNEMAHDIIRMRKIERVTLPAGQTVAFAPAGYHLMLLDLPEPLKPGDRFPLTLTFERAPPQKIEVEVRALDAPLPGAKKHGR